MFVGNQFSLSNLLGTVTSFAMAEPEPQRGEELSERQSEVLRLIALGHTNAEVAGLLYLSIRTVESHRAHIQRKLGLSSRAELVRYALEHGLVET